MLCHFYSTFLGPLPKTLDEFTKRIHQIFPRIVDTRILYSPDTFLPLNRDHLSEIFTAAKEEEGPRVTQVQGLKYKDKMDEEHGPYGWYSNLAFFKVAAKKLQHMPWLSKTRPQKAHGIMRMKSRKPSKIFSTLNPFVPDSVVSRRSSICSSVASGMTGMTDTTVTGTTADASPSVFGDGSDEEEEEKQEVSEVDRLPPWEAVFWEKFGNRLILDDGDVLPLTPPIPLRTLRTRALRNL